MNHFICKLVTTTHAGVYQRITTTRVYELLLFTLCHIRRAEWWIKTIILDQTLLSTSTEVMSFAIAIPWDRLKTANN